MTIGMKSTRVLFPDGVAEGYVILEGDKIVYAGKQEKPCDKLLDMGDRYVSPGFIDVHTHGGGGYSFVNCTAEGAVEACRFHMSHGTTTILPTFSTAPLEEMEAGLAVISRVMDQNMAPNNVLGVHMEGPFLSEKQCGAQRPGMITPPIAEGYEPLVEKWGKYISRWTYAPEHDEGQEFCKFIVKHGVLPSAGHTDARYEEMLPAIEAGCKCITHLYSCTSTVTREFGFRHLGVIETAYLRPDMDVEIIADGKHLPAELIQMILRIKGKEHVMMVTDTMYVAGTDLKQSDRYVVEDGVCKLFDRSAFAGSIATTDRLVRVAVKECGISVPDAVYMLTETPARVLGVNKGRLAEGFDADLVVFDDDINVSAVFVGGEQRI